MSKTVQDLDSRHDPGESLMTKKLLAIMSLKTYTSTSLSTPSMSVTQCLIVAQYVTCASIHSDVNARGKWLLSDDSNVQDERSEPT